jgi:hypothetical protein
MSSDKLLTIFTAPKPFTNPHIAVIQRNALRCWQSLGAAVEVIMVGDEEGMAEVAAEYGVQHLPNVECNRFGTPLISSIFNLARDASTSPLLMYANADILFFPDILDTARTLMEQAERFLLVGQRWDLDVTELLDFDSGWAQRLRADVQARGVLHVPAGSDYFLFPRPLYADIPDFAVGRAGWDNWMIYHATRQPWPVIDGTPTVTIVHQNHDYSHLPGGQAHYDLEETQINARLGGGMRNMYMVLDTEKELVDGKVRRPRFRLVRLIRALERAVQPEGEVSGGLRWRLTRALRRWRRTVGEGRA